MDGGWRSLARRPAGTVAIAGLAQAAALGVDLGLAHTDPILLFVLEIAAGALVAQVVGGWLGAMAGVLIGGTIVVTANTSLTAGHIGPGFLAALFVALFLFTPGYLLGSAGRTPDDAGYGAAPDTQTDEMTPKAKIAIAFLLLAADVVVVLWVLTTFRLAGP
jgi:hypothetical protein